MTRTVPNLEDIRGFLVFRNRRRTHAMDPAPLLDAIAALAQADRGYKKTLDRWLQDGGTILLRDSIAGPFRDEAWAARRPGRFDPFADAWMELDSARLHLDEYLGHVIRVDDPRTVSLVAHRDMSAPAAGRFVAELIHQQLGLASEERNRVGVMVLGLVRDGKTCSFAHPGQDNDLAEGFVVDVTPERLAVRLPEGAQPDLEALSDYLLIDFQGRNVPAPVVEDDGPAP